MSASAEVEWMQRAIELAQRGEGSVEPNPMVGCVIVKDGRIVGEGWHEQFGGPHAEVHALAQARESARGATLFVTLEPCCHSGKTPPCTDAIIQAGIARVVLAVQDPNPQVAGGGLARLRDAGLKVAAGLAEEAARDLLAPYLKRQQTSLPWVIAKWAMTLDGKIATGQHHSKWISSTDSRRRVHELRGRVDAILVGSGTAHHDDPLLTARPAGPRLATRILLDSEASLALDSQLIRTAGQIPLLVITKPTADAERCKLLSEHGVEIVKLPEDDAEARVLKLLQLLGEREMTNLLVEGGGTVLGSFFDAQQIDEVHVFVAPKIIGGGTATTPIAGSGLPLIPESSNVILTTIDSCGPDLYLAGRMIHSSSTR